MPASSATVNVLDSLPAKGSIVSLNQAADLVYATTVLARNAGCIPIAAAVLRPLSGSDLFSLEGFGHNELGWGRPFVHGETGAFRAAGVIDYRGTVLLSSLSPCEFCQGCAAHLGIKDVRYLDGVNLAPDQSSFSRFGIVHRELRHVPCCEHFAEWLASDAGDSGRSLWHQDIGSYPPEDPVPIDLEKLAPALRQATALAEYAAALGEYPCSAVIVDGRSYQTLAYGPGSILRTDDPTAVPEIFAGRQCAARTRWDQVIFVTSAPPSAIALGMYRRWGVRNVVVMCPETLQGETILDSIPSEVQITLAPEPYTSALAGLIANWRAGSLSADRRRYLTRLYGGI